MSLIKIEKYVSNATLRKFKLILEKLKGLGEIQPFIF
jgi:hypothetical protein